LRPSFYNHLHPPTIPAPQARFRYTLGAGGISVFLSLVVIATGILELFYYVPDPDKAALTIQTISYLVPYGWLVRNLHFWSAQMLVLIVLLHLVRVILTGAYRHPRQFNYLLGLLLLVLVLFFDFTGYVLRWDQGIHWALVTGTNLVGSIPYLGNSLYHFIVGGDQPNAATLIRFYAWHIFGLTLIFLFFAVWHLFRIRRDGGIAVPPPQSRLIQARISRFVLSRREALAALVTLAALLVLANLFPAPIAPPIIETTSPSEIAKAPWFFLWIQELLRYGDPFLLGILIPLGILLVIALIPYILPSPLPEELGAWFPLHNRLARWVFILISSLVLFLTLVAVLT
jgi:quinol-cytochrome oxidoreductase complex cytochrome b subunit